MDLSRFDWTNFQGVPDHFALDCVPTTPGSFLRDYVIYAGKGTDAPVIYHIGSALGIFSVCVPISLTFPFGNPVIANWWTMLVGDQHEARKTHAIHLASAVLRAAKLDPPRLFTESGSAENMIEEILERPQMLVEHAEFGAFMSAAQTGYKSQMKDRLTEIWDGSPVSRRTIAKRKAGGNLRVEENPRLSMNVGINPVLLFEFSTLIDWSGGFLSRFAIFLGARTRTFKKPISDDNARDALGVVLKQISEIKSVGPCAGFDQQADDAWGEWQSTRNLGVDIPERIKGGLDRTRTICIKAALLYAFDRMAATGTIPPNGGGWHVTLADLEPAMRLAECHAASALYLAMQAVDGIEGKLMRRILQIVGDRQNVLWSEILDKLEIGEQRAMALAKTLCSRGKLVQSQDANGATIFSRNITRIYRDNVVPFKAKAPNGSSGAGSLPPGIPVPDPDDDDGWGNGEP